MPTDMLAPIALFVYNRPQHTATLLRSLLRDPLAAHSELYVFADGPKASAGEADLSTISETRALFDHLKGFKNVVLRTNETNQGLAASVIAGVTEIVNLHGRVIVLEDDLILAPWFLEFMNRNLTLYEDAQNVYAISGYMFPIAAPQGKNVLLPYISTWGWATWQHRWTTFSRQIPTKTIVQNNPFMSARFNLANYDYTGMLDLSEKSWGICWYFSIFLRNGLSVFPTQTLVANHGHDGSGENCVDDGRSQDLLCNTPFDLKKEEQMDLEVYDRLLQHFTTTESSNRKKWISRLSRKK